MFSASLRKSVTDLSRRRARTAFSVLTLAIAVASISFFAIPTLIDRAMQDEVLAGRLADVTMDMRPLELTNERLAALAALPNVAAVEPRSSVDVRVLIGERRAPARVIGGRDFARQNVDVARVESGTFPRPRELPPQVQDENVIVFYAPATTVALLRGEAGYGELALRLEDPSPAAAQVTVDAVRRYLLTVPGFSGLSDLPEVRAPGDWPAKADTEQFAQLLGVITVLALLSALVLISNTMSTLVAEQTREIGIMRAVGARRRQIGLVYLRTTLLLGALGALVGIGLGIVLSSLLARSFGSMFWAIDVGFG